MEYTKSMTSMVPCTQQEEYMDLETEVPIVLLIITPWQPVGESVFLISTTLGSMDLEVLVIREEMFPSLNFELSLLPGCFRLLTPKYQHAMRKELSRSPGDIEKQGRRGLAPM